MHFHPSQLYLLFPLLASAPKVHWQAEAGAPASEQEPKLLLGACSHNHIVLIFRVWWDCAQSITEDNKLKNLYSVPAVCRERLSARPGSFMFVSLVGGLRVERGGLIVLRVAGWCVRSAASSTRSLSRALGR
jgi:hypothetical protein